MIGKDCKFLSISLKQIFIGGESMSIGQRLKTLRKEAGLSQKQVAEALKMSKPIVSQYESDQRTPSVPKLIRFSRFYKASLDYICENVEKKDEFYGIKDLDQ